VTLAVTPAADVDSGDPRQGADRLLQTYGHHSELGGQEVRKVAQVEVRTGLQAKHYRQAGWPTGCSYPPALRHPDVLVVLGIAGGALLRSGLAPVVLRRLPKNSHGQWPNERKVLLGR
jgi:hypothetical protein